MNEKNNIVLIGMPGSGKSTVGKTLAEALKFEFVDLDLFIENASGMKISEIFKNFGEAHFRNLETETIKALQTKDAFVLSTGGGAVLNPVNVENLSKLGKIYYLNASVDVIYDRIKEDNTRPLLQKEDPKSALANLYEARNKIYANAANYEIDGSLSVEQIVCEIKSIYEKNKR